MTSCRDVRVRLFAAVEGSLGIEETLALEAHARACAACADEMRHAQRLHEAFAQLPQPPIEQLDVEQQVSRIRAAIDRAAAPRVVPWLAWKWVAAASLILGAGVWLLLHGISTRGGPDAGSAQQPTGAPLVENTNGTPRVVTSTLEPEPNGDAPVVAGTVDPRPVAATPMDAEPVDATAAAPTPVDAAQLEAARETVRTALAGATPALEESEMNEFLSQFDAATADLARDKWPLVRLVERVASESNDALGIAALRWLGRRGDALSARRVALALDNPARKDAAARALVELWPVGGDAIVPALLDDGLRVTVLDGLASGDPKAAADVLIKATRNTTRPLDVQVALQEIERRRLVAATSWVEGLVRDRGAHGDADRAEQAVDTLAGLGDADALRALLRLRGLPRAQELGIDAGIERLMVESGPAVTALARDLVDSKRGHELRELHELLLLVSAPSVVPALIVVASSRELSTADRRFAILLIGEQGSADHVSALLDLFRQIDRRDRSLKAAALVALHAIGGRTAVADALVDLPRSTRERALSVLDGVDAERRPETTLLQLMKELEPKLVPLQL